MPASPQITVTGTLLDLFGSLVNDGVLVIQLCGYGAVPRVSGTALVARTAPLEVDCPLGVFSFQLWGNDVITPAGTFYTIAVKDDNGNIVQMNAYQFTGAGTFDLSTLAPYDPPSPSIANLNPVLLNPTGLQTIAGSITIQGNLTVTGLINGANPYITVAFSATPVFDCATGTTFDMTLTGNVTSSTAINLTAGQQITFMIVQDGTGGRTFVWPANVKGAGIPDLTPNAVSVQSFKVKSNGNLYPIGPLTVV